MVRASGVRRMPPWASRAPSTSGPASRAILVAMAGPHGLGHQVIRHEPGSYGAHELGCCAGAGQGERGAPGERGQLWSQRLESLRDGGRQDDEVRLVPARIWTALWARTSIAGTALAEHSTMTRKI